MRSVAPPDDRLRRRRVGALSLLSALFLATGVIFYTEESDFQPLADSTALDRSLREVETEEPEWFDSDRLLALNAASPPSMDEVEGEYIVKPWIGGGNNDVWETLDQTKVELASAQASSTLGNGFLPKYAIDDPNLSTRWASKVRGEGQKSDSEEWINIDMGMEMSVREVYIKWWDAYAVDYKIFVARERADCRKAGNSCPDSWIEVASTTGKSDSSATSDQWTEDDHELQGVRYVRVLLNTRAPGYSYFSMYYIRVYRKPMIVGESASGASCGSTVAAATSSLLGTYGGTLIRSYENAEFFAARMTEAQKNNMMADDCVFTVEPNYVVRARGRTTRLRGGGRTAMPARKDNGRRKLREEQDRRRLAVPEFNLRDENPANWGLERISSYGRRNGKYKWYHEGYETNIYVFDTAIYPDHSDWDMRNGTSRLKEGIICAGSTNDYTSNDHGTHMASIAAGWTYGTAKAASIIPIQVLDANGEGSTASVLCGMEKLLQDGIDYNAANAPKKIKSIVNLSLGVDGRSDALDKAVHDMTEVGYTVVIAAGDHDGNACFYSPYDPSAITVGALKDHEEGYNDKTDTSNFGECIDIWAPGEDIVGASNAGEYESVSKSGTSVAAAFVAGAASLFFETIWSEQYPAEEFSERVKEIIINKAEINILEDIGHNSVNKIIQTTVSRCSLNSHCAPGLTCLTRDGMCADLSKPLY